MRLHNQRFFLRIGGDLLVVPISSGLPVDVTVLGVFSGVFAVAF